MFFKGIVFCVVTLLAVNALEDAVDHRSRRAKVDREYVVDREDLHAGINDQRQYESGIQKQIDQLNSKIEMAGQVGEDASHHAEAKYSTDTSSSWVTLAPNTFFPFGKLDLANQNNCSWKEFVSYDVIDDQIIQCQKINDKRCYSSQETFFETYTTEVCDETYSKNCHISFTEETSNSQVEVCYTETRRVCDNRRRQLGGFTAYTAVNETCLSVFETVCESYKTTRVVSDDYADCEVQSLELCERSGKCPKVPKTKCQIVTKNVTKEIPESKCRKISKSICGPEDCPIRVMPEMCRNETKQTVSKVPVETCTLTPKKECRDVSILVPTLVPTEKCMDVPKEICAAITVPRNITRTASRMSCDNQVVSDEDSTYTTLPTITL